MITKKHILLIEDNENELEFFTDALQESNLNFLCSVARSSDQATRILKNVVPDMIFVDSQIAGSNVTNFLKNISCLQQVPVVLYSALASKENVENTPKKFAGYLQLPHNVQTMASILQKLLND